LDDVRDEQREPEGQNLADLIGSRLCHDLSNPLGAIGNGVELLEMTGGGGGPEMSLIRDAVADALARVRFLRLAFGHAGPDHLTSGREARAAVGDLYRQSRIVPDWTPQGDLPRLQVKLGFLMLLCADTALPMGGRVTVAADGAGRWTLEALSDRIVVDEGLWSVLRFGPAAAGRPLRPAEVQFPLLRETATATGADVTYLHEDGRLILATG
jgi:histidine phosphotransferase ChpT